MTQKRTGAQAGQDIRAGLETLFGRLDQVVGEISDALNDKGGTIRHEGKFEVPLGGQTGQGIFGVSIKMGLDGVERNIFGNIQETDDGPVVSDVREPLIDIDQDGADIVVTAELPGVDEGSLSVTVEEAELSLSATGRARFETSVDLPSAVVADSLRQSYTNGILEIRLQTVDTAEGQEAEQA